MKASGNGDVALCVKNLLRIIRGENPYERLKGLNARSIDRPSMDAEAEVLEDAEWCIETYEPRANIENLGIDGIDSVSGDFSINAIVSEIT